MLSIVISYPFSHLPTDMPTLVPYFVIPAKNRQNDAHILQLLSIFWKGDLNMEPFQIYFGLRLLEEQESKEKEG